ncbi:MAG: hypothetical protein ACYDBO_01525 [Vulcanimicrobiaceae bacterium]
MRHIGIAVALALCMGVPALAQSTSARLVASPQTVYAGSPITLTFSLPAAAAKSSRIGSGSAISIRFGDGSVGTIVLAPSLNGFSGVTSHVYAAAGIYTATASVATGPATFAVAALSFSATVAVRARAAPAPSPVPERVSLLGIALTWPDGAYHLHLSAGTPVPQPVARVRISAPGTIVAQWLLDGAPTQTVHVSAAEGRTLVSFEYAGPLPGRGSHAVSLRILSPVQGGLSRAATPPPIGYDFAVGTFATPSPTGTEYASLRFQGFIVSNVRYTKGGPTYSGTGRAHVGNVNFSVSFDGVTVVPDAALTQLSRTSVGDVTAGTAANAGSGTNVSRLHTVLRGKHLRGPCASRAYKRAYFTGPGSGASFSDQIGAFGRFGYTFSLMGVILEPVGTPSIALLCWAPAGVENAASGGASDGFNTDVASVARQLLLELDNIGIDEDGNFDADVPGDTVGNYRLGYTPFTAEPTKAQTLQLRFGATDGEPHAAFNDTPAEGPILQQIAPATTKATATICNWEPGGVFASISIGSGQALYAGAPRGFVLTIAQSILAVQNSAFLGGTMSGSFAAGQQVPTAPVKIGGTGMGTIQSAASAAYTSAMRSAAAFNSSQQSSSRSQFGGPKPRSPDISFRGLPATSSPSGQFSGSFTDVGDLVASATQIAPYTSVRYAIAPSDASLYVPGGQNAFPSSFEFTILMSQLAQSPLWGAIPSLDYSQPTYQIIGNVARFQTGYVGQIQNQVQQTSGISARIGGFSNGNIQHMFSGPASPVEATPAFPFPGLYVDRGQVTTPYGGTAARFDASTRGQGWGFAFTDDGGNSGAFSLQGNVRSTYGSFQLDMQLYNVELVDDSVVQSSFWGVLQIPAPIAAAIPVVVQQVNDNGALGALFVPAGVTIGLHAWNASLHLNEPTTIGASSIQLTDATLTLQNYQGPQPHVQGVVLSSGTLQNDQLMPLQRLPSTRVAGLDFTPLAFGFPNAGNNNVPVQLNGSGSIAGWSATQQILTLTAAGGGFAPPPGYHFGVSQSIGPVDMNANIRYSGNAWDGTGKIDTAGFLNASFGLHVDDQIEKGEIGLNVSGGSGNSSSGSAAMTKIAGEATFSRDDGSVKALAFGAALSLSDLSGHVVVLYDTDPDDPLVQSLGGTQKLKARAWNCTQAWCFAGSIDVAIDSNDNLKGELDGLFNSGFAMYASGTVTTALATVKAKAQLSYFDNGEWDIGFSYYPVDVLGVNFEGKGCFWNHHGGAHTANCLDTGYKMTGLGTYIGLHADANLGDVLNASANADIYASDAAGVGAHLDAHGSVQIAGIGPSTDASLDMSSNPLGLKGTANLYFCACLGSLDAHVGAGWYETGGLQIYDAGLGLGGPCGLCDPSNWF